MRHVSIGAEIKQAREKKLRISQDELARRIGASGRRTVIRWEKGETSPAPEFVPALARELGLDESLFEEDDDEDSSMALARELRSLIKRTVDREVTRR